VRDGKRWIPLAMATGKLTGRAADGSARAPSKLHSGRGALSATGEKQDVRMISTGALHALLRFHARPIDLVVYQDPYALEGQGELISRSASRLDAFSGYPIQT